MKKLQHIRTELLQTGEKIRNRIPLIHNIQLIVHVETKEISLVILC